MEFVKRTIKDAFIALLITIFAAAIGLAVNFSSINNLNFATIEVSAEQSCQADKTIVKEINTDEVKNFVRTENVLFVDGRSSEEFKKSHIKNALNIPYNTLLAHDPSIPSFLSDYDKIIIYYDLEHFDICKFLASDLVKMGLHNIYILVGDWQNLDITNE